ncbi:MAG: transposase family protein [Verrucomicrobia bacterium]|nr:transposase family protein [Verrucomicrobiota bacterium]
MTFTDEDGQARQFTWRTIQTWYSRYKKHGLTALETSTRGDKGKIRKVSAESLLEAVQKVLPKLHGKHPRATLYRLCIEQGLLTRSQVAPNTFSRLVKELELLRSPSETAKTSTGWPSPRPMQMKWQADTLYGPHVTHEGTKVQTRLIAFIDDASRVCCHGQFFCAENVDTLIEAIRAAFYKRGVPQSLYVDNGSIYSSKEIVQIRARVGCLVHHTPVRDGAAKGQSRTLLPHDPRSVPFAGTRPLVAGGAQSPVHLVGRRTVQRPDPFRPWYASVRSVRAGSQPRAFPSAQRGQ